MIKVLCFSPSGATQTVAMTIADVIAEKTGDDVINYIDVNDPDTRECEFEFEESDIVIAATPTYAGRVPNKIMPFYQEKIKGNGAKAITVTSFGNRNYDNSMIELYTLMTANGFKVMASGAAATRHSMSQVLGAGRPDEEDIADIKAFAEKAADKILAGAEPVVIEGEVGPYYTPLKEDGEKAVFLKAKSLVDADKCTSCGKCAELCPMGSIEEEAPFANTAICIKCHACIRGCEAGARYFDHPDLLSHIKMLEANYAAERKPNTWVL